MTRRHRATTRVLVLALVVVLAAAACGDDDDDSADESPTIRLALDWTPNTNHTGIYVAQEQGLFEAAGLDVEIVPWNSSSPDTLVGAGAAEFGVSFQDTLSFARAAGAPVVSVLAVLQHWAAAIGVRADRDDIQRPADLDGLTYAGFGSPSEEPILSQVIRNDGGTGEFRTVTLDSAAYEALYSGDVDFAMPFVTWEGIEAELRDEPLKTFEFTDYGFPDMYAVVIIGNEGWLAEHPDAAAAFVGALVEGYEFAAEHPADAAQLLIDANPDTFSEEELVTSSQEAISADYLLDADGRFGTQTLEQWTGFTRFLFEQGLLTDADGDVLIEEPDYAAFFTNDFLPTS
jgi:ABC-type nitrate/sulfonate/bicarbonate transport system substrate-binding protein